MPGMVWMERVLFFPTENLGEFPSCAHAGLERQVRKLAECAPDLAFLQEVNPLGKRLPQLARALSMEAVSQSDLSGIKIRGKGVPANLSSGLAILAKDEVRKLEGLRLSGSRWSFATADFSFQLSGTRYALLAELRNSIMGRLLVVNAHLHHGLEPNASLLEKLQRLFDDKVVSAAQRNEIVKLMDGARERRCGEGRRLVDRIEKLAPSYDGVILAGDMNADPESAVIDSSGVIILSISFRQASIHGIRLLMPMSFNFRNRSSLRSLISELLLLKIFCARTRPDRPDWIIFS